MDKDDLDTSEMQKIIDDRNFLGSYITSAKTGQGVYDAFNDIIKNLYQRYKELSSVL